MKIIDLLNKIANGEEVPKKVKFAGIIFEYDEDEQMYFTDNFKNICDYVYLTNEVEIIEEEKKIPEKIGSIKYCEDQATSIIHHKVDEIIDYLQYLKSKGDE